MTAVRNLKWGIVGTNGASHLGGGLSRSEGMIPREF